jgi:hypothetical protein
LEYGIITCMGLCFRAKARYLMAGRPGQQGVDVDPAHGRTEQPHLRQHREPPPHVGGHFQHVLVLLDLRGDLVHRALGHVGGHDHALAEVLAQLLPQHLAVDHELGGRLGRLAALADHVDNRRLQPRANVVQHVPHQVRVHVVQHKQPRTGTLLVRQQVVRAGVQRRLERDVPQGAAADAQHDQVGGLRGQLANQLVHLRRVSPVLRQLDVPQRPLGYRRRVADLLEERLVGRRDGRFEFLQVLLRDAMFPPDHRLRRVLPVQPQHGCLPCLARRPFQPAPSPDAGSESLPGGEPLFQRFRSRDL